MPAHLTPQDLAKKRLRDRKSQNAMRERTKATLRNLEANVAHLQGLLAEFQGREGELREENRALKEENRGLREGNGRVIGNVRARDSGKERGRGTGCEETRRGWDFGDDEGDNGLSFEGLGLELLLEGYDGRFIGGKIKSTTHASERIVNPGSLEYQHPPLNCAPTCLSDRILMGYVTNRRRASAVRAESQESTVIHLSPSNIGPNLRRASLPIHTVVPVPHSQPQILVPASQPQQQWLPGIGNIVSPQPLVQPQQHSMLQAQIPIPKVMELEDSRSVSKVVSDILLSYHEIDTLPRKMACLYNMYKLLNWQIHLSPQTFHSLPPFLHPIPLQLSTPHPAWIDRIPWPTARSYLILHPDIIFDDFASVYSSDFDVGWNYSEGCVVVWEGRGDGKGDWRINPVYEEHLRDLKNWNVGWRFRERFGELARLIDGDRGRIW